MLHQAALIDQASSALVASGVCVHEPLHSACKALHDHAHILFIYYMYVYIYMFM